MTTVAPDATLTSLDDRLQAFLQLGERRELGLRELIGLANDVASRDTDPDIQEAYRYIYDQLERRFGSQILLDGDHVLIKTQKALKEHLPAIQRANVVALDTETTGLDPLRSRVRLLQIGTAEGTYVIDLFELPLEKLGAICDWLAAPRPIKILHNAKFDAKMILHHLGVPIGGIFDTMLASQVISGGNPEHRHNLYEVTKRYLGVELDKTEQTSNWEGQLNTRQLAYAAKDVQVLLPLHQTLVAKLEAADLQAAAEAEFAAVMPISRVELNGLTYDQPTWQGMMRGLEGRRKALDDELQPALAGCRPQMSLLEMVSQTVNLSSEAELKRAFGEMGFDFDSLNDGMLASLAQHHQLMPKLSEVRWIDKVLVSFGEEIWRYLHPTTGRLHPDFFHLHGEGGVFRSNQPNLHAVPADPTYRASFNAPEGNGYLVIAWPHLELHLWAQLAGDDALGTALSSHEEPLYGLAAALTGQPAERMTPAHAQQMRALAYALAYGRSLDALSRQLQLGMAAVEDLVARFAQQFPQAGRWSEAVSARLAETGKAPTLFGRQMHVGGDDETVRLATAHRLPLYGGVSDYTKHALYRLDEALAGTDGRLVAATPGEVTVEGPLSGLGDLAERVRAACQEAARTWLPKAPVAAKIASGAQWLPPTWL